MQKNSKTALEAELNLRGDFQPPSIDEWKAQVEKDLKGRPFEKLISKTLEEIDLRLVYTQADTSDLEFVNDLPGTGSQVRGGTSPAGWEIRQGSESGEKSVRNRPLSYLSENGFLPESLENLVNTLAEKIKADDESVKLIIDGTVYSNAGADAVQELAIVVSEAVEYFNMFGEAGIDPDRLSGKFEFKLGIGADFFTEIAKLRAARMVWTSICETAGVNCESISILIHAESTRINKSIFDPHANMLRGTSESFAAVVGGADAVTTLSFDAPVNGESELGKRIARNTQIILKEESHLDAVIDPAGGSYYVESLTNQIANRALQKFKDIESSGGFLACLKSGYLQNMAAETAAKRTVDFRKRKSVLVGTNMFANSKEELTANRETKKVGESKSESLEFQFEPFKNFILGQEFEDLRINSAKKCFRILLLNFGDVSEYKPRADFSRELFESGGFMVEISPQFYDAAEASQFVSDSSPNAVVLCSSDNQYPEIVPHFVRQIRKIGRTIPVILAGYPKQFVDQFREEGISEFIYLGCDAFEIMTKLTATIEGMGK